MDRKKPRSLRELSKTLFRSGYQAELGAAIADSKGPVWATDLIDRLAKAPGKGIVSKELSYLEELDLLLPAPDQSQYDRRKLLVPSDPDGAYWRLCSELRNQANQS